MKASGCILVLLLATGRSVGSEQRIQDLFREAEKYDGLTVTSIQFDPIDQPIPAQDLLDRLPFKIGTKFRVSELQSAIQSLFATGRFSDLAVDASHAGGGVALRFLTKRAYFVGHVSVNSTRFPPNTGQLYGASKLRLGVPYANEDKTSATESMLSLLRENGFYNAQISSRVQFDDRTSQANLTFIINTGDRARFARPAITGHAARADASLVRATHWQRLYGLLGWQSLTDARVRQGLENIRRFYEKRDLLASEVTLTGLEYHKDHNDVTPTVNVEAGPKIIVQVQGAHISRARLRQLIPIFQERAIDTDLLIEGQRNLTQYLQFLGYFGAKISFEVHGESGVRARIITYRVQRGDRHKFVSLQISGNRYFPDQTIRERLDELPAQFPRFPHGRFSDSILKQDVEAIETLYASNGFRNAKVAANTVDNYRGIRTHVAAFIHISEGPQSFVSELSIQGVTDFDRYAMSALLSSDVGQPFSSANILSDRENVLNYFYDRGYLNAAFEYVVEPGPAPDRVKLSYVIRPGSRKYVRNVYVSGIETTRSRLVFDRIRLEPGQPLSLSEETESQRRLYNLGIFARVNTALQNPDGDEDAKNVLYDIDEARHYSLNIGIGAQIARIGGGVTTLDNPAGTTGFAPRLAIGLSRENFLGLGQTIGIQTAVSTIRQRAAVTYFIPQFIEHENLNLTTTILADNSKDVRTFTAHRREASIQLGERLSRAYTMQYRLVFRNVTQSNLKIDPLLVPLLSQPETVGLAEVSLIQDKRDDPTDAHRGIYSTIDVGYASSALGSQTQFGRVLVRNSTYHQLQRELVLARSTQFGFIERTGGRPSIPLAERLYSGGSTSIRAFPDFQAGPRDLVTGFPLGGDALFINNTELRFPIYGENVAGVLFHDAGNVYDSVGDLKFKFRQSSLKDFNYMVQNVGFGIRYRTPVGPLRVDLSLSPDAPRFFGLKGTLQDYLSGNAPSTVQKINAFQFHISLGQAF